MCPCELRIPLALAMHAWPEPVERVAHVLRGAAVDARLEELPATVSTAEAAARALGCARGQIVKSLVFVCDGKPVLVLVPGDRRADAARVAASAAAERARVATAVEVAAATGFEPGGVAPFPQRAVTRTLIDRSFFAWETVWIGAGTAAHMAELAPAELQRLTSAVAVDLTGPG